MHNKTALLALLAICTVSASASGDFVKLDFTKKNVPVDESYNRRREVGIPLLNGGGPGNTVQQYWVNVTVGTPPQSLALQLDTGSSDMWILSNQAQTCVQGRCFNGVFDPSKSSTYQVIANDFNASYYEPGDWDAGNYISEVMGIGNANITNMTMGYVDQASVDFVGLLGISFSSQEFICYMYGQCQRVAPTIVEQLVIQGYTQRVAYSLWLNDLDADAGSILFGAIDTTKYNGDLVSLPMQPTDASGNVTSLAVTLSSVSIKDNSGTRLLSSADLSVAAVLDSGTPSTEIPADVANAIINGMGAVNVQGQSLIPCRYHDADATIIYGFGGLGGPSISVPISEMLIDTGVTFEDGSEACTLGVDPIEVAQGGAILLGDTFMRAAYIVYDLENLEIAIAQTNYNATTTSNYVMIPSGTGLPGVSSTATGNAPTTAPTAASTGEPGGQAAPSFSGSVFATGTPTFDLGAAISATGTGTGASPSSSGSGSNSGTASIFQMSGTLAGVFALAQLVAILLL